ncbi:MAG: hypothetical protein MHM6MM_007211 [Cercozoa sp. M6MM]
MASTPGSMDDDDARLNGVADEQEEFGGAGVFQWDTRREWDLVNPEEAYDDVPQFYKGKNVADFIDPEIDAKLAALEAEEEERLRRREADMDGDAESDLEDDEAWLARSIQSKKKLLKNEARQKQAGNKPGFARTVRPVHSLDEMTRRMQQRGIDTSKVEERVKETGSILGKRRGRRRLMDEDEDEEMRQEEQLDERQQRLRSLSRARARSRSRTRAPHEEGLRDEEHQEHAVKRRRLLLHRAQVVDGKKGEGDRHVFDNMPKHLFSGKRSFKGDRR